MITEHYYMIMINEKVVHSTDDVSFFFTLLLNEYLNLLHKIDSKEIKDVKWTVYESSSDRLIIHFITKG